LRYLEGSRSGIAKASVSGWPRSALLRSSLWRYRFDTGRWMVAAEGGICLPSIETLGFFADEPLAATFRLIDWTFAYAAVSPVETGMATASAERLSRIADWRRQFGTALRVAATMAHSSFGKFGLENHPNKKDRQSQATAMHFCCCISLK
jgi:hypothetical protein